MVRRQSHAAREGIPTNTNTNTTPPEQELVTWFSQFDRFTYDPAAGIKANFDRLAAQRHWSHKLKGKRWIECQKIGFAGTYGGDADVSKLEKWQGLCREVYIRNPPESIAQCRKALGSRKILVNLVNLIDHRIIGIPVIRFKNYDEFWKYTSQGRRFPLEEAKSEGFIKALLRKL